MGRLLVAASGFGADGQKPTGESSLAGRVHPNLLAVKVSGCHLVLVISGQCCGQVAITRIR